MLCLLIIEIVRADWKKRPAVDRTAILAEMPKPFVPKVNMRYPVGQPLMTFPPNLLKQLHQLPEDLGYRFVGRDLILRDVKANIVVDVIRHALPSVRPLQRSLKAFAVFISFWRAGVVALLLFAGAGGGVGTAQPRSACSACSGAARDSGGETCDSGGGSGESGQPGRAAQAAGQGRLGQVPGDRRLRNRRPRAVRSRRADCQGIPALQVRLRDHARRQHVRGGTAARLPPEVRDAL